MWYNDVKTTRAKPGQKPEEISFIRSIKRKEVDTIMDFIIYFRFENHTKIMAESWKN